MELWLRSMTFTLRRVVKRGNSVKTLLAASSSARWMHTSSDEGRVENLFDLERVIDKERGGKKSHDVIPYINAIQVCGMRTLGIDIEGQCREPMAAMIADYDSRQESEALSTYESLRACCQSHFAQ